MGVCLDMEEERTIIGRTIGVEKAASPGEIIRKEMAETEADITDIIIEINLEVAIEVRGIGWDANKEIPKGVVGLERLEVEHVVEVIVGNLISYIFWLQFKKFVFVLLCV